MLASPRRISTSIAAVLALSLALPAFALGASTKPTVTTGGVAKLTPSSVSLLAKVDPNGAATTYLFQYGATTLYGAATAPASAGGGANAINVVADVAGARARHDVPLPRRRTNGHGTVKGADRTLKTKPQPLGLSLAATPNPVGVGKPTVLAGTLSGTGNSGRQVVLQSNPFPYTQGFAPTSNIQLTGAQGEFAFPLLSVALNTQYRVLIPTKPEIVSPIVTVGVAVKVGTSVSTTRLHRGGRVRFSGTIRPAREGARVAIQRLSSTGKQLDHGRGHDHPSRWHVVLALLQARADHARRQLPRVRREPRRQPRLGQRTHGEDPHPLERPQRQTVVGAGYAPISGRSRSRAHEAR